MREIKQVAKFENAKPKKGMKTKGSKGGGYRRNGNVARLAKETRDKINMMIRDGVPYAGIIEKLGPEGKELDISNLSRWKDGGYQDWLVEQAFITRVRARQETPGDLTRDFDGTGVGHAALQLGTLHIFEALRELAQTEKGERRTEQGETAETESGEGRVENGEGTEPSPLIPLPSDGRGEARGQGKRG